MIHEGAYDDTPILKSIKKEDRKTTLLKSIKKMAYKYIYI